MDQHEHGAKLRRMERKDLQAVLDLINAEGWDYHISELERILAVDPESSIVAFKGRTIVGATTVVVSGGRCVLGHVVVKDGWRNKGIGRIMMDCLEQKMDSTGVGLMEVYSVKPASSFYNKHGYRIVEEIVTYDRTLTDGDVAGIRGKSKMRPIGKDDLGAIHKLDKAVTGFDRRDIIRQLMSDFPATPKGLFEGGKMTGFIMGRHNPIMNDIGPWVMARPGFDDGVTMLRSILGEMGSGRKTIAGVTPNNKVVAEILLSMGFKIIHKSYRMLRTKGALEPFLPGVMAIGAFELG